MKKAIITIHHDAGHGWASVTRRELIELGIETFISPYSYQSGGHIYLEEDCDLTIYCNARGLSHEGIEWVEVYDGDHSPIRKLRPFEPKRGPRASREARLAYMARAAREMKAATA